MILGVTGTNGAGKGAVVDALKEEGFMHYSVREEITRELARRGLPADRPHMGALGNELREKNGPAYFVTLFKTRAQAEGVADLVIDSLRSVGEARALKEAGGVLLAVDADRKLRYERAVLRGSSTDKVDFDTWVAQEEKEWGNAAASQMNIPAVMQMADYTVHNDGTLEELHRRIDQVLEKIKK